MDTLGLCDNDWCETPIGERGVMRYTGEWTLLDGKSREKVKIYCSRSCSDEDHFLKVGS